MDKDDENKRDYREPLVQIAIISVGFIVAMLILACSYSETPVQILNIHGIEESAVGETLSLPTASHTVTPTPTPIENSQPQSTVQTPQTVIEENSININTADSELLDTLPGIGSVLAERIIQFREQNGGFSTIDELKSVSGIGEKTYEKLCDYITVG